MKSIRLLMLASAFLLGFIDVVAARAVRMWTYQELIEKSDLVVIATPTATNDTMEQIELPGFVGERVLGIETRFAVSGVLKGDKALKDFVFHHYRPTDRLRIPNGPTFVSFKPVANPTNGLKTFILFLVREADGRYSPTVGQSDPAGAVRKIGSPAFSF